MQASDICKKPILNEADSWQKHVMDSVRGLRTGIHPKTKIELTSHTLHGLLCAAALAMVLEKRNENVPFDITAKLSHSNDQKTFEPFQLILTLTNQA